MSFDVASPSAIAEELGERLKQTRLNSDMTQAEVAASAGLSRKVIISAEKGKVQLESLVAIMLVLGLQGQLDNFLPKPSMSPIQLAKLQGKKRQRASGQHKQIPEESSSW